MGKRDKRVAFMNPIALARAKGPVQQSGPSIKDYLGRSRPTLSEIEEKMTSFKKKGSDALAAWEDQMNESYKDDLKKHRERKLKKSVKKSKKKEKKKKSSRDRSRSRSPSPSSSSNRSHKKSKRKRKHIDDSSTSSEEDEMDGDKKGKLSSDSPHPPTDGLLPLPKGLLPLPVPLGITREATLSKSTTVISEPHSIDDKNA
ncbi:PREDICTED: protein FAM133B-like isoform X1 [Amphimedon queenslandica]|uniref:Uncharacterized protein n=1 Tax=Amphimedon queenslandica TaxID=400682 RepID=A0A1X7VNN7_AMPQE|nr:PREDICTED: protein FAM133B-like isoform X1 [Amphimedon queenslandica]|eukprot:XP_011409797.1 PREDICTED: protein FAM133B-like isoform X1 [Amphimedon queenslandica]